MNLTDNHQVRHILTAMKQSELENLETLSTVISQLTLAEEKNPGNTN